MSPYYPVNALIWLAVGQREDTPAPLKEAGFTDVRIEVLNEPSGLLPIDVVAASPVTLDALAVECKTGSVADAQQWNRYLALEPRAVGDDFGYALQSIEACYMVQEPLRDAFVSTLTVPNGFEEVPAILAVDEVERRVRFGGEVRFADNRFNHVFSGAGASVPRVVPSYVDLLPDDSKVKVARFVLKHLPSFLRANKAFTSTDFASRCGVWAFLGIAAREQLVKAVDGCLHSLKKNELKGWHASARGKPQTWNVYKRPSKAKSQQELVSLIAVAAARYQR